MKTAKKSPMLSAKNNTPSDYCQLILLLAATYRSNFLNECVSHLCVSVIYPLQSLEAQLILNDAKVDDICG